MSENCEIPTVMTEEQVLTKEKILKKHEELIRLSEDGEISQCKI